MTFSLLYPAERALIFSHFSSEGRQARSGRGREARQWKAYVSRASGCFVLAWKTRQNSACSPGYRHRHRLSYPRRKKERSWEQEQKVEPSKNLNCDQAFLFSRNGIARKSANEERRKRGRRPFLLAPKAKTEEGPPDRSLPKTEKSHWVQMSSEYWLTNPEYLKCLPWLEPRIKKWWPKS